jgi:hypothetical protein
VPVDLRLLLKTLDKSSGFPPEESRCPNHRGVMVTIIADNYYGYCKKEVKTQISCCREFGHSRWPSLVA